MKKFLLLSTLLVAGLSQAQTPCVNGFAGAYPCNNIDLMAQLDFPQIGGNNNTRGSGCWGWTDPLTNKEYALMGCSTHTAFVDITNPSVPIYLGKLNAHNNSSSIWRELTVYNNHAYIVSEANGHGLQIFDLTRLRNVTTPQTFTVDARYDGFGNCHTVSVNQTSGFLYCDGTGTFNGGPHVLDLQNPVSPTFSFGYATEEYTHDAQIIIYDGPDPDHQGKELFIGANETKVVIVDVTDKQNPTTLSTFFYGNTGYTHQGWFTSDKRYWILGDELDELNFGFNSKSIIVDMTDLDNPILKGEYSGPTEAIDHNGFVRGNEFFLANYTAGLRILNTSNITATNTMTEVGFFDSYPEDNSANFNGAWNNYPYFPSGTIIISDIDRGLFVVRKNAILASETFIANDYKVYPNPASLYFAVNSEVEVESVVLYDLLGKAIKSYNKSDRYDVSDLNKGLYFVKVNNDFTKKLMIK
ncbi:MAG: choice-of-anchor B family protein [Flavobacterium sp.]|nr:choice-of-anchor B family protein [Flavobacterium sp.]